MLSIVVPTLNEEKHLPWLLASIKKQEMNDYEIIVSDAGSKDSTLDIAKKYGCRIVKGGLPPKGKNRGAEAARGELILFVDADVVLNKDSLAKFLKEFKIKNLDAAGFLLNSQGRFYGLSYGLLYNLPCLLTEKFLPQAMSVIMVKRSVHQKIKGFDEKVRLGEDVDYVRRAAKVSRFGVLKSGKVFVSPRRFQRDGWLKTWFKYFLYQIHMLFLGPVRSDIFRYRLNRYKK